MSRELYRAIANPSLQAPSKHCRLLSSLNQGPLPLAFRFSFSDAFLAVQMLPLCVGVGADNATCLAADHLEQGSTRPASMTRFNGGI